MTNKNKRATDAPKRDYFMEKPYDLQIHGVDDVDEDHMLADRDKKRVEEIDSNLLTSMRLHGVVRVVEATKRDDIKWVVDGRRRVIHARIVWDEQEKAGVPDADRILVPVKYVRGEDILLFLRARVHNSGHREEAPLARARDIQLALAKGASEADVAASMSTDVATVKRYLSLLEADPKVVRAVESGKISATVGMTIAKVKGHDAQRLQLDELLASGNATQAEARRAVNKAKGRADGVGVASRKVLRELRTIIVEPDDESTPDYRSGFAAALSIVLGDGDVDAYAKKWLHKAQKVTDKRRKEKTA